MPKKGAPLGSKNAANNAVDAPFKSALRRLSAQEDYKRIHAAANRLLDLAASGEAWAVKELADRTDGKSAQGVTVSGDPDKPVNLSMRVLFGRD